MLILTRKLGESIQIGDEISIRIIDVKGKQVRLGIEAPPNLPIHREEIYLKILEENRQAASLGVGQVKDISQQLKEKTKPRADETSEV